MTLLTVLSVVVAVVVISAISAVFIKNNENVESDQLLLMLCETGEHNLNYYFDSVQKSVAKVASHVEADLDGLESDKLARHVASVEQYFDQLAYKTNGVLTYYYRIDPTISDTVKGFWYTNLDGNGFVEHEPTDISQYDTNDTSQLVWFTVPKNTGKPVWLPPYITDNLNTRVISYNVPIYWKGTFVGVVGIEIDYSTMAEQVESIRLYSNGYAFLSDDAGNIFFHPYIDVATLAADTAPSVPSGMTTGDTFYRYTYNGVEKRAAWLPLSNGMRINVTVPVAETDGEWQTLILQIFGISLLVLVAVSAFSLFYTRRITKPLEDLTRAADLVDRGNYDFKLDYDADDELGMLTRTFKKMAGHVRESLDSLSERVYVDALTSVKNKGAFSNAIDAIQTQLDDGANIKFAIGVFDCDDLKVINDRYGHDKGDMYLKTACHLICSVFQHSPVFRIGGDEFAVILRDRDYENREALVEKFYQKSEDASASAFNRWEEVRVTTGLAVYDPQEDTYAADTVRRADKLMYANKRQRKKAAKA